MEGHFEGDDLNIQTNVHSDDGQISVGIYRDKSFEAIVKNSLSGLVAIGNVCCLELSVKKVDADEKRKEFVGRDNYNGEQQISSIKPSSSVISGTPFTSN